MDGSDKLIQADVSYSPKFIYDAIKLTAEARLKGEKLPATTIIPSVLITKDNAKEFYFPDPGGPDAVLIAGALSSSPDKARASGRDLGLADARNHGDWQALLADELRARPHERVDFVSIVTPNHVHFPVAQAFVEAGLSRGVRQAAGAHRAQADALVAHRAQGTVFGVTYNYTGYPMVRQAREMVRSGELGRVRKVVVEYNQGWLATPRRRRHQQAGRLAHRPGAQRRGRRHRRHRLACREPGGHRDRAGLESLCADLSALVPGRTLDDDGSLLLRFKPAARAACSSPRRSTRAWRTTCACACLGTLGTLEWHQEQPSQLVHLPHDGPKRVLTRGAPWLCESAQRASRLPAGHPEGFIEAFANVYAGVAADIRARLAGEPADPLDADYPRVEDGARGVRFIERTVASAQSELKWTPW
jgi:predicted dehydrogenase